MGLDEDFALGIKYVQSLPPKGALELTNNQKLMFYGLYKQGVAGPCNTKAPSRLRVVDRAKWEAWKAIGTKLSKEEAKRNYVQELSKLSPQWKVDADKLRSKL
jgi:acyl-CoA-binding protein